MIRIKYTEVYGLLRTDWFTVGPNMIIRGIINLENNYYEIRQFDQSLVTYGKARSLRQAKDFLRRGLTSSGVNFDGEIRKRK